MLRLRRIPGVGCAALAALLIVSCSPDEPRSSASPVSALSAATLEPAARPLTEPAPPASQTGGFDGAAAYSHVAKLVGFGPHPPASDAIHRVQDYIRTQLKDFGCSVDEDDFHSATPIGDVAMKNLVAKIPGESQGIILLLTHYDTARIQGFVGAEDSGSSTGLMLEMAHLLCAKKKQPNAVWIAFLDGEEAQVEWTDTDSVYGSRELAARLAVSVISSGFAPSFSPT